jgi:hypothetical protein
MKKQKIVTVTTTNSAFNTVSGQKLTVLKRFFDNGEGWIRAKTEEGKVVEIPDVFVESF